MKLDTIQLLRGLAALAVTLYHLPLAEQAAIDLAGSEETAALGWLTRNGFAGVDVFFVISGFIMVYVTRARPRGARSAADFLAARVIRIYPLWWVFAAAAVAISLAATRSPVQPAFGVPEEAIPAYLAASFALVPQDFPPVLNVGWTLIHEMYFYLVFAALLLAPQRLLPMAIAAWAAVVVLAATVFGELTASSAVTALVFHPLTLEFTAGAAAALLIASGVKRFALPAALAGGGALALAMIAADGVGHGGWSRALLFGAPATLLIYGLAAMELDKPRAIARPLVFLGDASYALYLAHTLVFIIARRVQIEAGEALAGAGAPAALVRPFQLGAPGPWDNLVYWTLGLSGALIAAAIAHLYVERPALRGLTAVRLKAFPKARRGAPGQW
ncbi:MAG: acyltransferase [Oceanicaulis sp.]